MHASFKGSIRTRLGCWSPAAVTLLSIFSAGMGECVIQHRKPFAGHQCIFCCVDFYSLV